MDLKNCNRVFECCSGGCSMNKQINCIGNTIIRRRKKQIVALLMSILVFFSAINWDVFADSVQSEVETIESVSENGTDDANNNPKDAMQHEQLETTDHAQQMMKEEKKEIVQECIEEEQEQEREDENVEIASERATADVPVWDGNIATSFAGGSGTEEDPYQISCVEEMAYMLQTIGEYSSSKYCVLTNDIYINRENSHDNNWNGYAYYGCGVFDGNGHTIYGLYNSVLFKSGDNTIKNLTLKNAYYDTADYGIGLCGEIIDNCHVYGEVNIAATSVEVISCISSYKMTGATINNCTNHMNISLGNGSEQSGIICPFYTKFGAGTIENCVNYGDINTTNDYRICGINIDGNIYSCKNYGNITGGSECYGIGVAYEKIVNCVNYGNIVSTRNICGIGQTYDHIESEPMIQNCVNEGNLTGGYRVYGIGVSDEISDCKNYGTLNGKYEVAGIGEINDYTGRLISNCKNYGELFSENSSSGIVAGYYCFKEDSEQNDIVIQNCENYGDISAEYYAAGIIETAVLKAGYNLKIENCINEGNITAFNESGRSAGITRDISVFYDDEEADVQQASHLVLDNCINKGNISVNCDNDSCFSDACGIVNSAYIDVATEPASSISITRCSNSGTISSTADVSGIVGYLGNGTNDVPADYSINKCYNVGDLIASGKASTEAAGIVGNITGGDISDCYNSGEIYAKSTNNCATVGGIANRLYSGILDNLGSERKSTIKNCYNIGSLTCDGAIDETYCGMLAMNNKKLTDDCHVYNLSDYRSSAESGVTYLSRAEMKNASNFVGFDFDNTWQMGDGYYPYPIIKDITFVMDSADNSKTLEELGVSSVVYTYGSVSKDVLTSAHAIENTHAPFKLEIIGDNPDHITKYQILSGKNMIAENDNGIFEGLDPSEFTSGKSIYIVTVGQTKSVKTKILLDVKTPEGLEKIKKSSLTIGGSGINLKLPDDVPLYGGQQLKFNMPASLPISAIIEDGRIKIGINIQEKELHSSNSNEGLTTSSKKENVISGLKKGNLEKQFKKWQKDMQKSQYISKDMLGYLQQADLKADMPLYTKKVSVKVMGYAEGTWSDCLESISGQLLIAISGDATFQSQYVVVMVPITLNVKISGNASAAVGLEYDFISSEFLADLGLALTVSIEPYAGVGAGTWCSVGVYGNVSGNVDVTLLATKSTGKSTGLDEASIQGSAGIKAYFAKKEVGRIELISSQILNKTGLKPYMDGDKLLLYSRTKNSVLKKRSGQDLDVDTNSGLLYDDYFTTEHLDESSEILAETTSSFNQIVGEDKTVVDDVYEVASPIITSVDGTKILIYTDIDNSRKSLNQTAVYYSVYDQTTEMFSNPVVIDNDNTADFRPQVYQDGDELYVYFADSNTVYDENVDVELSDYAASFGISVYKYNRDTGKFEEVGTVYDGKYCYHAALYNDNGALTLAWVENDEGNAFGTEGINSIKMSVLGDSDFESSTLLTTDVNAVTALVIGQADNKLQIVYVENPDNNLYENTNCNIVMLDTLGNKIVTKESQVSGIRYTDLYQNGEDVLVGELNGSIVIFDSELETTELLAADFCGAISDFVIDNGKIYCVKADENGGRNVTVIEYMDDTWCSIKITDETDYVDSISVSDGMIVYLLTRVDMSSYENEDTDADIITNASIKVIKSDEKKSVSLEYADFDAYDIVPGNDAEIAFIVTNKGTEKLHQIEVVLYPKSEGINSENAITKSITVDVLPGESLEYAEMFTIPESISNEGYVLALVGDGIDSQACEQDIDLAKTDIAVSGEYVVTAKEKCIKAYVANLSYIDTEATTTITDSEGNVLFADVQTVRGNDCVEYTYELTESDFPVDGGEKLITIQATTEDDEYYLDNNTVQQLIYEIDLEKPKVADESDFREDDPVSPDDPNVPNNPDDAGNTNTDDNNNQQEVADQPISQDTTLKDNILKEKEVKIGKNYTIGTQKYKVTSVGSKPTVTFVGTQNKNIKTVKIPNTVYIEGNSYKVTAVNASAFSGCKKLTSVTIGSNVNKIGSKAFKNCIKLKTVSLGKNISVIENYAFEGCKELSKVTLPAKVTKIGKRAFYNCKKLKSVTVKGKGLKKVGASAFKNIRKNAVIKVPKSKKQNYTKLLKGKMNKDVKIK